MQPFQQRVVDEKRDLDDKLVKLSSFFSNPTFGNLPKDEQKRLQRQAVVMKEYSDILGQRIVAFGE